MATGIFSLPFCDWCPLRVYSLPFCDWCPLREAGKRIPQMGSNHRKQASIYPKQGSITGGRRVYTPSEVQSQEAGEHIPQVGSNHRRQKSVFGLIPARWRRPGRSRAPPPPAWPPRASARTRRRR
eukprot:7696696-Pyramimonas_sp.AAC.1